MKEFCEVPGTQNMELSACFLISIIYNIISNHMLWNTDSYSVSHDYLVHHKTVSSHKVSCAYKPIFLLGCAFIIEDFFRGQKV